MARRHGANMFADKNRTRSSKVLLSIMWQYLSQFKGYIILIGFITLFYTAAVTFQPIIVEKAIDGLIGENDLSSLTILVVIYFALAIVAWVSQSLTTWYMAIVQNSLVHSLRTATFEGLVNADMTYHHQNQSGNITSRVINDTQEITTGLAVFTTSATNLLVAFSTLGVLFSISVWFGLISLLALPTAFMITKIISSKGKAKMMQVRSAMGRVSGKLAENLSGVAIAKSFNQEDRTSGEIRKLNEETFGYFKQLGMLFTMIFPSITLVSMLMIMGVLISGGYLNANNAVTLGSIYLGTVMVRRFISPILALSNNITNLQASLAALDRVTDVLNSKPGISNKPGAVNLQIDRGEIVIESVSFAYAGEDPEEVARKQKEKMKTMMGGNGGKMSKDSKHNPEQMKNMREKHETNRKDTIRSREEIIVLNDVSFTIPAGKKTALVGHTGAGKTTITKLLLRFYDPKSGGSIKIDGQDLRDITLESLYDSISLVSQEPYLFVGSVLDNIKYGKPGATDNEVYAISELLGANQFIDALAEGYDTYLTESGKSLSAGQRQMITIARTMLSDPKILILDEATSRLDAFTESLVQEAQNMLFENRTTLIIAHRLSTIRDVDQIVVMDDAKVVEIGNHDELMQLKGKYYELYRTYYAHQGLETIELESE